MKNKFLISILASLLIVSFANNLHSKDFIFESDSIEIKENGNLIVAKDGVNIKVENNIEINSDQSFYNKTSQVLLLKGNVILLDKEKNIKILSNNIEYNKINEKIISGGKTTTYIGTGYIIDGSNITYLRKKNVALVFLIFKIIKGMSMCLSEKSKLHN